MQNSDDQNAGGGVLIEDRLARVFEAQYRAAGLVQGRLSDHIIARVFAQPDTAHHPWPAMIAKYLFYASLYVVAFGAILFGSAGDMLWPQAWIFPLELTVTTAALVAWLARHDPELLRERFAMRSHRDQVLWDRVFFAGMMSAFVGWLVLIAFDERRFQWSHMPATLEAFGALLYAASIYLTWLVFRANTFAVPQVRIQAGRKQTVATEGPYRFVRHPMYAGTLLYFVGLPLLLGSWLGLLAAVPLAGALAARCVGEERMLRRHLEGYDGYAARVKWRFVPGIW